MLAHLKFNQLKHKKTTSHEDSTKTCMSIMQILIRVKPQSSIIKCTVNEQSPHYHQVQPTNLWPLSTWRHSQVPAFQMAMVPSSL